MSKGPKKVIEIKNAKRESMLTQFDLEEFYLLTNLLRVTRLRWAKKHTYIKRAMLEEWPIEPGIHSAHLKSFLLLRKRPRCVCRLIVK